MNYQKKKKGNEASNHVACSSAGERTIQFQMYRRLKLNNWIQFKDFLHFQITIIDFNVAK